MLPVSMKRAAPASLLFALFVAVTGSSCKENKAATEQCKGSDKAEACEICCKENGAPNYAFVSGGGCMCRE